MQLYASRQLCNYMQLYATMQLMQLYETILKLYETILQQFCMQLYANMQLCNLQLMKLKQLYGTYATLHNYIETYATRCGNFNFVQLYDG